MMLYDVVLSQRSFLEIHGIAESLTKPMLVQQRRIIEQSRPVLSGVLQSWWERTYIQGGIKCIVKRLRNDYFDSLSHKLFIDSCV